MSDWDDGIIADFRANDGTITAGPMAGWRLALLTTTGAKSGEKRTSPTAYFDDGDRRLVIASKGGAPEHPAWYHNLLAHPEVHVEVATDHGVDEYDAIATPLPPPERDEKFTELSAIAPGFADYQRKTDRIIPVVAITRR